jgi:hypothetical protein
MLRVIATLAGEHDVELSPTFMGAHEIAPEYSDAGATTSLVVAR